MSNHQTTAQLGFGAPGHGAMGLGKAMGAQRIAESIAWMSGETRDYLMILIEDEDHDQAQ